MAAPCQVTEAIAWSGLPAYPYPGQGWSHLGRKGLGDQLVQPPSFKDKETKIQGGEGLG